MATFVMVAGSWHGGWCWERTIPLLEGRGHRVRAPDLLGMGNDRTPLADVTLARWADQIAALLRAESEPVVLVGHSRGGIVISEVAERVPERIRRLVYLSAFLLPDGASLMGSRGSVPVEETSALMTMHADGTSTLVPEAVGTRLYNTTAPEWLQRAAGRLGPEPLGPAMTPLALSAARFGSLPRAYIECTEDRALALERQRAMHADLRCDPVITLATDHSPFYSDPEALAVALAALATPDAQRPSGISR